MARSQSGAEITIFDDGVGLPKGFSLTESSNLGLQIVRTLAENELRGNIDLVRTPSGTEARLTFPI